MSLDVWIYCGNMGIMVSVTKKPLINLYRRCCKTQLNASLLVLRPEDKNRIVFYKNRLSNKHIKFIWPGAVDTIKAMVLQAFDNVLLHIVRRPAQVWGLSVMR